jgi:hypothetical protein
MPKKCKSGETWRDGYTAKRGSKKVRVKGTCVKRSSKKYRIARDQCAPNEVMREGYRRKDGTWVAAACVPGVKRDQMIYIEPDRLSKYGYEHVQNLTTVARHDALRTAIGNGENALSVARRLQALSTLHKNTNPILSHIFKEDSIWLNLVRTG